MYSKRVDLLAEIESITKKEPGTFSVAVIDLSAGQETLFNPQPLRSASLIKLFIMAEVFAQIKAGRLSPKQRLCFHESDRVGGAGTLQYLPAGASRSVMELTEVMITESDNIATNLLINLLGEEAINNRIRKLGAPDTLLRRRMMDFAAAAVGRENLTSAADVARFLQKLHRGCCIDAGADRAMREILGRQTDRCKIPLQLPPGILCQNKTGELPGAEHDAGIIYSPTGPYVLAIMSDDLPDHERGCQTIAALSRSIYDIFTAGLSPRS